MNKGLEATLNNLKKEALKDCDFTPYTIEELDIKVHREEVNKKIIEDYKILEKSLKTLEIIKDKVQFEFLEEREEGKIIQRYFVIGNCMFPVTKEEYDLLKEVLL